MKIVRAAHYGFCFGVRDAIALARQEAERGPIAILGPLVHNPDVVRDLSAAGVGFAAGPADAPADATLMITAHGASERRLTEARAGGRRVMEATCPLVRHAHRELRGLVEAGCHPVVVGRRGHVEVIGLTEDLEACDIVLTEQDLEGIPRHPRYGVMGQTTQPADRVRALAARLQELRPESEVVFRDTVCRPTRERQEAAVELARQCGVVVVVGGRHSNNTQELAATCRAHGATVYPIEMAAELDPRWFRDCSTVGLTAGTSTPEPQVDAVESKLRGWFPDTPVHPDLAGRLSPTAPRSNRAELVELGAR